MSSYEMSAAALEVQRKRAESAPATSRPWAWMLALVAGLCGGGYAVMSDPGPAPVVEVDYVTADLAKSLEAIKALACKCPPAVAAPTDPKKPDNPEILTVEAISAPGVAELRASGKFTEIRWNRTDIRKYENDHVAILVAPPGSYAFVVSASGIINGHLVLDQQTINVVIDGPPPPTPTTPDKPPVVTPPIVTPDPTIKPIRATYVYERRQGSVPPPVLVALDKLNRAGVVANPIDQNVISGKGQAPAQHAVALSEAAKAGIPCLVVEYSSGAPKVVKNPTTEAQVMEAAK